MAKTSKRKYILHIRHRGEERLLELKLENIGYKQIDYLLLYFFTISACRERSIDNIWFTVRCGLVSHLSYQSSR